MPWNRKPRHRFSTTTGSIDAIIAGMMRLSGTRVSRTDALSVPAVRRGRNMLCSPAALPIEQLSAIYDVVPSALLRQIDPDVANVITLAQTIEDLVFDGIAWWKVTSKDFDRFPVSARHLDVGSVTIQPPKGRTPAPLPAGHDPRSGVVWVDGVETSGTEVIRFDSPNPAVLHHAGREIRRAILLDQAAGMYADDPRPMDYFAPAEDADELEDDEIKEILNEWKVNRKLRATAYVPASMTYHSVDAPAPRDLQLVELQRQASLDIANALGVDPEDLGISTTSRTYSNDVDRRRNRLNDVLNPYMAAVTQRLSMGDVTKRGYTVAFNTTEYLMPNPTERWAVYDTALRIKAMTVEEIRRAERMPPMPEVADDPAPVTAVEPVAGDPALVDTVDQAAELHRRAGHTFSDDGRAAQHFVRLPLTSFSVDRERRIITGEAVPYGEVANQQGFKFRFKAGSLQFGDVTRVKLLKEHDPYQGLGYATHLADVGSVFSTRFKVARGPEQDRALELAEDLVLDGLSVGVDFDIDSDDVTLGRDGVYDINRADLVEVSLTALPAFTNARVTSVAASRNQGATLPDTPDTPDTPGPPDPPATPPPAPPVTPPPVAASTPPGTVTFTAEQVAAMFANGGFGPAATPDVVNPTRVGRVTEPEPYRFSMNQTTNEGRPLLLRNTHEFSSDVFAAFHGDHAARQRCEQWITRQFDATTTTDVTALNPNRQRPDMYVDQRDFQYPIWNAINKGTLADITPFVFPKFSSAATVVAAHVQGTEPVLGDIVATNQTVTPTAISGKFEINREVIDAGGNPQVTQLIWNQMTKGWFEALEAAAVAELDAATPTSLATFTVGGGTNKQTLVAELEAALALLHFVRGGFTMNNMFAQVDLYSALMGAKDTTLRPYFPAIGPMNARGTVATRFGALDINGVIAYPAWALAATGVVAASSYLFDSDAVHGWASAPQRLDFDVQVKSVFMGLWGYKATAISDINGVREVIYDPV